MTEIRWDALDRPFSESGDSGSLVYLADTLEPLGILTAGGILTVEKTKIGVSYACPIAPILKAWKLKLN
jgi:hypothetical protein